MASVKGANITNMDATPIVKVDSENAGGKMRVFHDTFEASSLASGSDITIARIPKAVTGLGHRTTAETDILITTGGASATGTIFCWVYYTTE
jgi:hypothetical protein